MSCPRCAGLMVAVELIDWEGAYTPCPAQKCVSCGNVIDTLIATHHQQQPGRRRPAVRRPLAARPMRLKSGMPM